MPTAPQHEILFEPVKIGPVTAKNRFYQVPHCTGMGYQLPRTVAAMREVKAEGGWAVVNTEYCSMHPSSDDGPYAFCTLWDEDDVRNMATMTEGVHRHGALAGVQLWHGGMHAPNRYSRMTPLSVSGSPNFHAAPQQTRAMEKSDIRDLVRWQGDAARRAVRAGFDIVYVYAGHDYLPLQFLSERHNRRTDEYGGSLENRLRLLRELLEATREAVEGKAAVAIRLAVDEILGDAGITHDGEGREIVKALADLPDLWDVNVSFTENDSKSARFSEEGFQEDYTRFVKEVTGKPVVGVGRYTSPDRMAGLIRKGHLDLIGAARPSIADPFMPKKVEEGRTEAIRECIGCNICRSGNNEGTPIRCTQNPTMGEEWRRGWHPDTIQPKGSDGQVLIIGGGPAGLEAARAAGQRGYSVALAEAGTEFGGRILRECKLPGLSTWLRVRDWRLGRLTELGNVETYLDSPLTASDILEFDAAHIAVATGAEWRRDGLGAHSLNGVSGIDSGVILTPDDILSGTKPPGESVLIYDDDHYYMAGAIAEKLALEGYKVRYVTPSTVVSEWTAMTNEQGFIQTRLLSLGVEIVTGHAMESVDGNRIQLHCIYGGPDRECTADSVVLVTARVAKDALYRELVAAGAENVTRIGDCDAPGALVHAVYAGHRFARELDEEVDPDMPFRRDRVVV